MLYSRSDNFLIHKQKRYFNRPDIINHHPYSVDFDIFSLFDNRTIELRSFHYPIYFDFLPVFRFDPCASNPCNSKSSCKPVFNQNNSFTCSCESGYSGYECENYHPECSSSCHTDSICQPYYRSIISHSKYPLCICPLGHFGPRCHLRNEICKSNPCALNSTCHPIYDSSEYDIFSTSKCRYHQHVMYGLPWSVRYHYEGEFSKLT